MEIFAAILVFVVATAITMFIGPPLTKMNNRYLLQVSVIVILMLIFGATYVVLSVINAPAILTFVLVGGLISAMISTAVVTGTDYGIKHPKKTSTE